MTLKKILGLAGTGKTARLLDYINIWKEEYGLENICVETYRREMARELKNRVTNEDTQESDLDLFGTTHAICKRIHKDDNKEEKVVKDDHKKDFCDKIRIPFKGGAQSEDIFNNEPPDVLGDQFFNVISWLNNNLKTPDEWLQCPSAPSVPGELLFDFMEKWIKYKKENNLIDFDDMLRVEYEESSSYPNVDVLIVDEFQDKAKIHHEIYKKWKKHIPNVVIAGDPHQCLYDYQGASPTFFYEEEGDLEILPKTWRLSEDNWLFARSILENAGYTNIPNIECREKGGFINSISPSIYPNWLSQLRNESTYHLVRCKYMTKNITKELIQNGIPFEGPGGWSEDQVILYNALLKLKQMSPYRQQFFSIIPQDTQPIYPKEFAELLKAFPKNHFTGQKKELSKNENPKTFEELKWELSPLCWDVVSSNDPLQFALKSVTRYGKEKITQAIIHHKKIISKPTHYVGTIHSAKGGEANNTFLFDNITKKIQRSIWDDPKAEARVFFVGATRQKQRLFIVNNMFNSLVYRFPSR